ncbi:ATP-binding cassette domain-containing protein [Dactylosporangium matsuzakiense]|uniref:ATP-binding cassette domain-containing protein n=1 Tax=Dactylosporangium matsuzakiense TaxID=53360 RepID=UPI0021C44D75|nr:ABC transporter ATP-binding protein [Dactylosporangium matsuzakiense]
MSPDPALRLPAPALIADGVTVAYGDRRALDDCSFAVPAGSVTALVGRNGAGKTTLLRAAAGLLRPDRGTVTVLGGPPGDRALPRIGFLAQDSPLYRQLSVAETLRLGARLNPGWAADHAWELARAAGLPLQERVGRLAPGVRARLALIMALGKRPDLLLLDEPLAALDPVARAESVQALMGAAAGGTTVVLSTHAVADLAGVCDHVVVLDRGRVRAAVEVDAALAGHRLVNGAEADLPALDGADVIELRRAGDGFTALVRVAEPVPAGTLAWHTPNLEELVLGYLRGRDGAA